MKTLLFRFPGAILLLLPPIGITQDALPQIPTRPALVNPANPAIPAIPAIPAVPGPGALPANPELPPPPYAAFSKFDLDFPGGTPEVLVRMISEATGRPLNVIVPEDLALTSIPPIKLRNVTVPQLFAALAQASRKDVARIGGYNSGFPGAAPTPVYQFHTTSYGFFTQGDQNPDSVWYFRAERPPVIPDPAPPVRPKTCRFFQLSPYLEEYKVEDITTAVETAWKMLGRTNEDQPEMKFHKDTNLLIVVGSEDKVSMIDAVLKSLTPSSGAIDPATGLPIPSAPPGRFPKRFGQPPRQ